MCERVDENLSKKPKKKIKCEKSKGISEIRNSTISTENLLTTNTPSCISQENSGEIQKMKNKHSAKRHIFKATRQIQNWTRFWITMHRRTNPKRGKIEGKFKNQRKLQQLGNVCIHHLKSFKVIE